MKSSFGTPNVGATGVGSSPSDQELDNSKDPVSATKSEAAKKALSQLLELEDAFTQGQQSPTSGTRGDFSSQTLGQTPQSSDDTQLLNELIKQQLMNVQLSGTSVTGYSPEMDKASREQLGQLMAAVNGLQSGNLQNQSSEVLQMLQGLSPAQQYTLFGLSTLSQQRQQPQGLTPGKTAPQVNSNTTALANDVPTTGSPTATAKSTATETAQQLVDDAEQLFNKQQFKEAYAKFNQALQKDPTLATSWPSIFYNLGVSAEYSGDDTLLDKAKANYQQFLKAPGIDPQAKTWVQNELQGGLAAQIDLQGADAAFKKNDYDGAFKQYQSALKDDPTLAKRWPAVFYQLGVSAEYAKDKSLNGQAASFYQQYLKSPNPDPQTQKWVQDEVKWLTIKPAATGLVQKAQDQLYNENNAAKAFSTLKGAVDKYPELTDREPDVYYNLALYAYSAANVGEAQKYLDLAKAAMQEQLKSDPKSDYAKYYMEQINSLQSQIKDPVGNWTTSVASWLGDKVGGRGFWQTLLQGTSSAWINQDRLWGYDKKFWEAGQVGLHADSKTGSSGVVKMDTAQQKSEFDTLNAQALESRRQANDADEEVKKLRTQIGELRSQLEQAVIDSDKGKETELNKQIAKLENELPQKIGEYAQLSKVAEGFEESRQDFIDSFKGKSFGEDRVFERFPPLSREEKTELYNWDRLVRENNQQLATKEGDLGKARHLVNTLKGQAEKFPNDINVQHQLKEAENTLSKAQQDYQNAESSLEQARKEREGYIDALKKGPGHAAKYSAEAWEATLASDRKDRDKLKSELNNPSKNNLSKEEINQLKSQLAEAEKHVKNSETMLQQARQLVDKENNFNSGEVGSKEIELQPRSDIQDNKKTTLKGFGTGTVIEEGERKSGGRMANVEDTQMLGPGWWGLGTTLDHQQAAAFQWHLGTNADGKITNDWRGPFATTSNADPTQQQVTLASGGKGADKYYLGANAGVNIANVEHRDFDMVYGGSTASGIGIGGMIGDQARADLIDEQAGLSYSGGETNIGGEKIDNLVSASVSEAGSVGAQTDADVGVGIGYQKGQGFGANIGAGAGAFAGAQVSGMASGSVDGVGAAAMGQAWAGIGVKANAHISLQHGKLSFDLGLGAALGVGGYVDLNATIDFNQIAKELEGVYGASKDLAEKWGKKAGVVGELAGGVVGGVEGVGKLAADTVSTVSGAAGGVVEKAGDAEMKLGMGLAKKGTAAAILGAPVIATSVVAGEVLKQGGELLAAPKTILTEVKKAPSKIFSDAGQAFKKGEVVTGLVEGATGAVKEVGEGIKYVGEKVWDFFKKW